MNEVRIKMDTVPMSLRGKEGYISRQSLDSEIVTITIKGEGSYRYLRSELEPITKEMVE